MDTLVTTAIVGTGQQNATQLATDTPVDLLTQQLAASPERTLLLTAGALNLYSQAGQTATPAPPLPPVAPVETLPVCPSSVAHLISSLFTEHNQTDLLSEPLLRLASIQQRLPYTLLPLALAGATTHTELRPLVLPVLGERGYWLSARNPAWSWVQALLLGQEDQVPATAETIWEEGSSEQRVVLLHLLRANAPDQARDWLTAVWKQEKAALRTSLLGTFEMGLSPADEPFLELALDDRSESVRTTAISLLNRLPASAHIQRLTRLADAHLSCITFAQNEPSDEKKYQLATTLPETYDKSWQRDGIAQNNKQYKDQRQWWLLQIIARIPPAHWEERFTLTAAQLVALAAPDDWQNIPLHQTLLNAWAEASLAYRAQSWLLPLWQHEVYARSSLLTKQAVISALPQDQAEQLIARALNNLALNENETRLILALPTPWSESFALAYIEAVRVYLTTNHYYNSHNYIVDTLNKAVTALPPASIPAAEQLADIPLNESAHYFQTYAFSSVQQMLEKIKTRMIIMKELA